MNTNERAPICWCLNGEWNWFVDPLIIAIVIFVFAPEPGSFLLLLYLAGVCLWVVAKTSSAIIRGIWAVALLPFKLFLRLGRAIRSRPRRPAASCEKPSPAPTNEQRAAAAKARYEATLRLLETAGLDQVELRAAREHARQKYCRELDEVMK